MVRVAQPVPAQLTRDFNGAISMAASTAAITCSVLVTSVGANMPPISLATAVPLSSCPCRSATTTRTPRSANRRDVAAPSPEAPPVTIADVPFRSIASSTPCSGREMCRGEDTAHLPALPYGESGLHLVRGLHAQEGQSLGQHTG